MKTHLSRPHPTHSTRPGTTTSQNVIIKKRGPVNFFLKPNQKKQTANNQQTLEQVLKKQEK